MAIPTMSNPWFDAKGKMTEEEPATPEEVQALKEFLTANITAPTAAKRIMTMNEDQISLDDKVIRVSCLIFDAVIHFQAQQPSLIELIDAVHELSDQDLDLTVSQKMRYPRLAAWKNFDQFELLSDDMRRTYWAYRCLPDEEDVDPRDCHRRWASVNAFLAHRFVHVKDMKLPAYCMSIICDALEQEPWKHPPSRPLKESEKWRYGITVLDAELPAAAQWILIAGRRIYEGVGKERFPGFVASSDQWPDDESGLSKQRWAFWKRRLQWVQQQAALHQDTRMLAADAFKKMDDIESGL